MTHLGNCQTWNFEPTCCDLPDDTDPDLVAYWQAISSEILWAASGRRQGLCEVTVRPCLRRCGGSFGFVPYKGGDGQWRNFATCGCIDTCSCVELCEVVLEGPVAEVTEVLIDGIPLGASQYRVDLVGGQYRLLRVDGACWPDCSDLTADCGSTGAFCVTYLKGIPLDALAIAANSELTCELTKACIPGCKTCRLPSNVSSVVRRGVAITFDNSKAWLKSLPMVAAFLDAVNPRGLTSASTVWSPDLPAVRLTPEPTGS
jgi:hypothetical protein